LVIDSHGSDAHKEFKVKPKTQNAKSAINPLEYASDYSNESFEHELTAKSKNRNKKVEWQDHASPTFN
jgi:hypothetical protein